MCVKQAIADIYLKSSPADDLSVIRPDIGCSPLSLHPSDDDLQVFWFHYIVTKGLVRSNHDLVSRQG